MQRLAAGGSQAGFAFGDLNNVKSDADSVRPEKEPEVRSRVELSMVRVLARGVWNQWMAERKAQV